MSGSSLASFSRATSAMGPKMTTGLRNPAAQESKGHILNVDYSCCMFFGFFLVVVGGANATPVFRFAAGRLVLTFPQHHPLVGRELGLDRLRRQILPALPQVPLGASQPSEPPEVGSVSAGGLGQGVLHAGQLLGSGRRTATAGVRNTVQTESFSLTVYKLLPQLGSSSREKNKTPNNSLSNVFAAQTMRALPLFDVE